MRTFADLINALDAANPDEREAIYAENPVLPDPDALMEAWQAKRPSVGWLAFRTCATEPGVALPDEDEALHAVCERRGTTADAYVLMQVGAPLLAEEPLVGLLNNCAYAALQGGGGTFFAFLASRSAMAWLVAGEPERAWVWLELDPPGRRMPWFEDIRALTSLRGANLLADGWFRRAMWGRWEMAPPTRVPRLPLPEAEEGGLVTFRDRVTQEVPEPARAIVFDGLRRFLRHRARQLDDHPTVRALRNAVLLDQPAPPTGVEVPPHFENWVHQEDDDRHHEAARLGALLLRREGRFVAARDWIFLARAARLSDLDVLVQECPEPGFARVLAEVGAALPALPSELQEPLLVASLPMHPAIDAAWEKLHRSVEVLRGVRSAPVGYLERLLTVIDAFRVKAPDPADVAAWHAAIQYVRDGLTSPHAVEPNELEARIAAAPRVSDASAPGEVTDPLDCLVVELLSLRTRREGAGAEKESRAIFRQLDRAQQAVYETRQRTLAPLRLRLLDELVASADDDGALAVALARRANTRNQLLFTSAAELDVTLADLRRAMALAERAGLSDTLSNATAIWAKTVAKGLADCSFTEERRTDAIVVLDRVLVLGLDDISRFELLWAKAAVLSERGPAGAPPRFDLVEPLLREALECMPAGDPYRLELVRARAHALLALGRNGEALTVASGALDEAAPDLPPTDRALLHHQVGACMEAARNWAGAEENYRDAVRLGAMSEAADLPRIRLAFLLINRGRLEEADDHLERLVALGERLPLPDRIEVARARMASAARRRDRAGLEAEIARAVALAGPEAEGRIRLESLVLLGDRLRLGEAIGQYVAGRWAASAEADALVGEHGWNHAPDFPATVQHALLNWARRTARTPMVARLLTVLGQAPEASRLLRKVLREPLGRDDRVQALILLLATIPPTDAAEHRRITDELEACLEGQLEHYDVNAIADLAAGLHLGADGDPGRLARARMLAEAALARTAEPELVHAASVTRANCIRDSLRNAMPRTSSEVAELARALFVRMPDAHVAASRRWEAAQMLLWSGPLAHPEALAVAAALLAALPATPDVLAQLDRADALAARASGATTSVVRSPGHVAPEGEHDAVAAWLVDLVAGREGKPSNPELVAGLGEVAVAVGARPDRADAILAALFAQGLSLPPPARRAFLDLAHDAVAKGDQHAETLPVLLATIAPWAAEHADRQVHRLLRAIYRARGHAGEAEGPVTRLAEMMEVPVGLTRAEAASFRFERADLAMRAVEVAPLSPEADAWRHTAVDDLRTALRDAGDELQRFDFTVSLGNALRLQSPPRGEEALAFYASVAGSSAMRHPESAGKLHKVWADALRQQGRPEDLRGAWFHVEEALRQRRDGWRRAEVLWSAAMIAREHPDWDPPTRERREIELYAEAMRIDSKRSAPHLPNMLTLLAGRIRQGHEVSEARRLLDELAKLYPMERQAIERARRGGAMGAGARTFARITRALQEPNLRVFYRTLPRIQNPARLAAEMASLVVPAPPGSGIPAGEQRLHLDNVWGNVAGMTALSEALLEGGEDDDAGRGVARAHAVAALARLGAVDLPTVASAVDAALERVRAVSASRLRAELLEQLADVWSAVDHRADPVADFERAHALLVEAVDVVEGEANADRELLESLARACRYRTGGEAHANLREARRLYTELLRIDREEGRADAIANTLICLADVEEQVGDGDRVTRLRRVLALEREAVVLAHSEYDRAFFSGSLGWTLTRLGALLPPEEGVPLVREGLALFESIDRRQLEIRGARLMDNEHAVCASTLARMSGDRAGDIRIWRERLMTLHQTKQAAQWALACHNLAVALTDPPCTERDLGEGIELYEQALTVRTLGHDPRHHWESTFDLGRLLVARLAKSRPGSAPELWTRAYDALRAAIVAGTVLGSGEELASAGESLAQLALLSGSTRELLGVGDEAWAAVQRAAPYLLVHEVSRAREAQIALRVAFTLADRLRVELGAPPSGAFVLDGLRADRVVRWLLRVSASYQRVVSASLRQPAGVPTTAWQTWRRAFAGKDAAAMVTCLTSIHKVAPTWLLEEPVLTQTWAWLAREPGSVAVSVYPGDQGLLLVVLDGDKRQARVLLLPGLIPGLSEGKLAAVLRDADAPAVHLPELVAWAQAMVAAPVQQLVRRTPSRILWCPHGVLRLLPPGAIWPRVPASVCTTLDLRGAVSTRPREATTTVFYADADGVLPQLGEQGRGAAARLAAAADGARVIASEGARSGAFVVPEAVPAVASAAQLLRELDDAGTVVILAHGQVDSADVGSIACVGSDGRVDMLDLERLAADPGGLAGVTAILLSCETGRVGDRYDLPGGVAGILLAAGAKEVVAPLWPVEIEAATGVGEALLRGYRAGLTSDLVLARLDLPLSDGPILGPPPSLGAQQRASAWDRLSFVRWVG